MSKVGKVKYDTRHFCVMVAQYVCVHEFSLEHVDSSLRSTNF